jgi:hypothetical protein
VECQIGSGEQRQALEDKERKKALEEKMNLIKGHAFVDVYGQIARP